jgi:hypothetical protein
MLQALVHMNVQISSTLNQLEAIALSVVAALVTHKLLTVIAQDQALESWEEMPQRELTESSLCKQTLPHLSLVVKFV